MMHSGYIPDIGLIYYINQTNTSKYKIGKTKTSVQKRISELQIGNPDELALAGEFKVDSLTLVERLLHRVYGSKRLRGEWFELDDFDVLTGYCTVNTLNDMAYNLGKKVFSLSNKKFWENYAYIYALYVSHITDRLDNNQFNTVDKIPEGYHSLMKIKGRTWVVVGNDVSK